MSPEEARRWLKEGMEKGSVPQLHARRALQTIAAMEYETHQDQDGTTHTRLVTPARTYEWNS